MCQVMLGLIFFYEKLNTVGFNFFYENETLLG